jgi:hypothetical protein
MPLKHYLHDPSSHVLGFPQTHHTAATWKFLTHDTCSNRLSFSNFKHVELLFQRHVHLFFTTLTSPTIDLSQIFSFTTHFVPQTHTGGVEGRKDGTSRSLGSNSGCGMCGVAMCVCVWTVERVCRVCKS